MNTLACFPDKTANPVLPVFLGILWAATCAGDSGTLATYSYPDVIVAPTTVIDNKEQLVAETRRSMLYSVSVTQGDRSEAAYVMFTPNPHDKGNLSLSPHTHWTNFSFSGKVTVEVACLQEPLVKVDVFPAKKAPAVAIRGNSARFELDASDGCVPLQLFLHINGNNKHPLFIFADPEETDVPDRNDHHKVDIIHVGDDITTVRSKLTSDKPCVVFEEGVHAWGTETGNSYAGYQLPYRSNKQIYIPGGAYVIGSFDGENVQNSKIYGRGVVSGCGKDRIEGPAGIPYSMIHQTGSSNGLTIEGIVSTDPPHFHLTLRGRATIDNVKMIGYWYQTDGIATGDDSVVRNTFIKTNDDYIKLYSDNSYYQNNTLFHQVNGAPFQLCWGSQNGDNNYIRDTYLVASSYSRGDNNKVNTAVINSRYGSGAVTENNVWDGVYIDNGCHRLIGLNAQNEPESIFRNLIIRNVFLNSGLADAPQDGGSYLANGSKGNFINIRVEGLRVDGDPITGTNTGQDVDGDGKIWFTSGGDYVTFIED